MNPQDPYQQPQNPSPQGSSLPPVTPAAQYNEQSTPAPTSSSTFAQNSSPTPNQNSAPVSSAPFSAQNSTSTPQSNSGLTPIPALSPLSSGAGDSSSDDYTTVDYLNRIAPTEQKTINRFAVFGLIGAVLLSVVLVFVMMISSQGPDVNTLIPPVSARIETLASVSKAETGKLTQTEISEANASLSSALTSMQSQIDAIIKDRKIKSTSSKTEKAYLETLQKKLDDSYQKGTLDRTYTTQMTYELSLLKSQINTLKRTTKNSTITEFCESSVASLDTILEAYGKFDASKS